MWPGTTPTNNQQQGSIWGVTDNSTATDSISTADTGITVNPSSAPDLTAITNASIVPDGSTTTDNRVTINLGVS